MVIPAKSVDQLVDRAARERRAQAFRLQRTAAAILPTERVGLCRWAVVSRQAGVDVHLTEYDGGTVRASCGPSDLRQRVALPVLRAADYDT